MRNGTDTEIDLLLLRHGATIGNQEQRYIGRTDEHLSELGIQQMRQQRIKLCELNRQQDFTQPEILFVSPMLRCRESASILWGEREQIEIEEWREMDFGRYEGKNYLDLQSDSYYQNWIDSNGTLPFPGGESQSEFIQRCFRGFIRMQRILREQMKYQAAAVVHGGTIMALMSLITGGSYYDYQVKNAGGYYLKLHYQEDDTQQKIHLDYAEEIL